MDSRRLEAFCKVYELKSFSRAGEKLFLSQPTISAHISALESELGVQLFDRLGRVIMATTAGDVLYNHAAEAFRILERAKAEIALLQDRVAGELVVGASTIPTHYLLPSVLKRFVKSYPEVNVALHTASSAAIIKQVLSGSATVGIVGAREDANDLVFFPVGHDESYIIAAPDLISGTARLDPEDLTKFRWVIRERGSGTRRTFENALTGLGIDPGALEVSVCVDSTQAVLRFVMEGHGLGVVSGMAAKEHIANGSLLAVDVQGLDLSRIFYGVHHARRKFFPAARYFIEFLKSWLNDVAEKDDGNEQPQR